MSTDDKARPDGDDESAEGAPEAAAPERDDAFVEEWRAEGRTLRRWMRRQVASEPRDRETWAILEELADAEDDERPSYEKLAEKHGMTEAQLYKRIERLREKYRRRYLRWRNRTPVALLRWSAAALVAGVFIAWAVWKLLSPAPPPQILSDPDEPAAATSRSR